MKIVFTYNAGFVVVKFDDPNIDKAHVMLGVFDWHNTRYPLGLSRGYVADCRKELGTETGQTMVFSVNNYQDAVNLIHHEFWKNAVKAVRKSIYDAILRKDNADIETRKTEKLFEPGGEYVLEVVEKEVTG